VLQQCVLTGRQFILREEADAILTQCFTNGRRVGSQLNALSIHLYYDGGTGLPPAQDEQDNSTSRKADSQQTL
jgi:hypothetical protein